MDEQFAPGVRVEESTVGIRTYRAVCDVHPDWKPGSAYDRSLAVANADAHGRNVHDGVDYEGMPAELAAALRDVANVEIRRRIARAAREWTKGPAIGYTTGAGRPAIFTKPEPPYYQCRDCSYGTYGVEDFRRHADEEGHTLDIAEEG